MATATSNYDLKKAVSKNQVAGLWRMMSGFRLLYLGATVALGFAAVAKTLTYLLLRYFVDNYFVSPAEAVSLPIIAAGFIGLAFL